MAQRLLRFLSCFLFTLLFVVPNLNGQQRSPYKKLLTAINTAVADTVSGINLDVNLASPLAKHGDVYLSVIVQGGSGNPYIFEIQYVPDPGFIGVDSFILEYRYASTYPYLIYRGFKVSVMPSLVKAQEDFATTAQGVPVTIPALANDSGAWPPLTITELPLLNNGTAVINSNNEIVFTPKPGFLGVAHLNYTVCDALNTCQTSSVHIGVNTGLPSTDSLLFFTKKNQAVSVPLTYEGYTIFQAPAHGIVSLNGGRSLQYAPNTEFQGSDQFILKTSVNNVDYFKTFHVKVFNVQSPNTMAMDDVRYTPKNQAITFNVRDNDIGNLLVRSWSTPINFPGTLSNTNGAGSVTFTPNTGFLGIATFTYKIGNSSAPALEIATVMVVVDNLAPPTTFPYHLSTPKETPFVQRYEIPFSNFSFTIVQMPKHGDMESFPGFTVQNINGQAVSGNNLVVYTPEADYTGPDDYALLYCAPNGTCSTVKINIDVVEITATDPPFCIAECAWPGDANADGITNNKDILPLGYIMGQEGTARIDGDVTWYGQYSSNWDNPFNELPADLKFGDADGNGIVNTADISGIEENYNRAHNLFPKSFNTGKGPPFFLNLWPQDPDNEDLIRIDVLLGNSAVPAIDVYGYTFDMSLSPTIVDSAFLMTFHDHAWISLNAPNIHLAQRPSQGRFETAYSRTNGKPASGYGVVATLEFIIIDIVDVGGQNGRPAITVNPMLMQADGSSATGEPITLEIPLERLKNRNAIKKPVNSGQNLLVYPSPAQDILVISLDSDEALSALTLLNAFGQQVLQQNGLSTQTATLNVGHLPAGMYTVVAQTAKGMVAKKVQILHF